MFGLLNGMRPEREGFPFSVPPPALQKGKPRDFSSLALSLATDLLSIRRWIELKERILPCVRMVHSMR